MSGNTLQIKNDSSQPVSFVTPAHSNSFFPPQYKIMIIGKCGVGKTSLLWRFLYREFKDDLRGTIIDKETKRVEVKNTHIELELWDTASMWPITQQYL